MHCPEYPLQYSQTANTVSTQEETNSLDHISQYKDKAELLLNKMQQNTNRKTSKFEREQIIANFQMLLRVEKGYLVYTAFSMILCVVIELGLFEKYEDTLKNDRQWNGRNVFLHAERILSINESTAAVDYYLLSLFQNAVCLYLLYQIITKDDKIILFLKLLQSNPIKRAIFEKYHAAEMNQNKAFKNRLKENPIKMNATSPKLYADKMSFALTEENVSREVVRFEEGILERRDSSGEEIITFQNVLWNMSELDNFKIRVIVATSKILICAFGIAQMSTNSLDPRFETPVRVFLGLPALAMILPPCVQLVTSMSSVAYLTIYGFSILLMLTYSVLSNEWNYQLRNLKTHSCLLKHKLTFRGFTCSICIDEFNLPEEKISILPCNHPFHYECIQLWIQEKDDCPVCRKQL